VVRNYSGNPLVELRKTMKVFRIAGARIEIETFRIKYINVTTCDNFLGYFFNSYGPFFQKFNNFLPSTNIIIIIRSRRVRMAGNVASMGQMMGKPKGKRQLGRHRCRCEGNIKIGVK
jgi:hypothetical protein